MDHCVSSSASFHVTYQYNCKGSCWLKKLVCANKQRFKITKLIKLFLLDLTNMQQC